MDFLLSGLLPGIIILLLFIIGTPVFVILGSVAVLLFYNADESVALVAQNIFKLAMMPALLTLPLFVFGGYYLSESSFAKRLLRLFEAMTGWIKGGVCFAAIISTDIFTAFTGASAVTIIAFGGLIVPILIKKGYSEKFAKGLLTISGGSGVLFPPCIAVIIFGIMSETNIRWLYIAGFIPALIFILSQFVYSVYISYKENIPTTPFSLSELTGALYDLKWEIPLMLMVVSAFFAGIITIEEAATMIVVGFFIIETLIRREVALRKIPDIMSNSMMVLGAIFIIMGCAVALTDYLVLKEIPQQLMEYMQGVIVSKTVFLIFLNLFLLVAGMIMDMFSAILVLVPIILPIAKNYGVDVYHLGVIFFLNMEIGFITPPFGQSLFVSSLRFNTPVIEIFKAILPFVAMEIAALIVITFYEDISLYLLKLMNLLPLFDTNLIKF